MTPSEAEERSITIAGQDCEIWPQKARIEDWVEPTVKIAQFPDAERIRPGLVARALGLEHDETLSRPIGGIAGCRKIYHVDRWNCPEAALIDARAQALFKRVVGAETSAVDLEALKAACELSASARIEQGGANPLSIREWTAMWQTYSAEHWSELALEFPGSNELPWQRPDESTDSN